NCSSAPWASARGCARRCCAGPDGQVASLRGVRFTGSMRDWTDTAEAYDRSFATLCAGTAARILEDLPAGALLDVGCGTGRLAAPAERHGPHLTGPRRDSSLGEAGPRPPRGPGAREAPPGLAPGDESTDAIAANFVINHVGRPRAALAELRRVLRPGG